ncbi:hypothetical protein [Nonomuraea glycinis]|uniref:hypothetical protein n=1 Tax=Nonomuraea glycinis TaxID=2047744 RepID=UPI002E0E8212|nr:hypothetical protein OHA68_37365 [Nonomuraea glycinis]
MTALPEYGGEPPVTNGGVRGATAYDQRRGDPGGRRASGRAARPDQTLRPYRADGGK